ncbi:ABC transporter ATP-binding protein [Salimicrobium humidisoli]|uniref:ABC transporter ATP-binding protein n=1 Tax=Salimicrobium humidisoli TaxID=2029857 RepID=A0ABX4HPK1_9BACI|nr:ABC transporter ATP-binding protein [Salimicrobium humidisoli]PBB04645.1 ABC transporter ATP-binding protein [Salimicrobium humidisoli]
MLVVNIEQAGYPGDTAILEDIHFSVKPGELVGLIGPNGAGKSTAVKSILGILNNFKGNVEVSNYSYVPERPIFYERATLWEHIDFLQAILQVHEKEFMKRAEELLEIFQLTDVIHHYPDSFSKGMQQKVMLILAFLRKPDLYIIDEPFMGLDPRATKILLNLLEEEKKNGAGVLMSTHVLDTAEKRCDRFVLLSNGRLIVKGSLSDIQDKSGLSGGTLFDCFDKLMEGES